MVGKTQWWAHVVAGHLTPIVREQRDMDADAQFISPFHSLWDHNTWNVMGNIHGSFLLN